MQNTLTARLAERLRSARRDRGYTLDQLADLSGISRAGLSRFEKGEASPTIEVIGKLCAAFELPFSRLVAEVDEPFKAIVHPDQRDVFIDPENGLVRQSVSPPSPQLSGEIVRISLPPETDIRYATPPIPGQEHHLLMLAGDLTVTVGQQDHHLSPGDCLRFKIHDSSRYKAGPTGADYHLVLI